MDHRLVIAPARPAARAFAVAAATTMLTALIGSGALAQAPPPAPTAPPPPPRRPCRPQSSAEGGAQGCTRAEASRGPGAARAAAGTGRRSASAHLFALDQVLPEGPGGERQAGLFHRQGRKGRIGDAGGGSRADRAGK